MHPQMVGDAHPTVCRLIIDPPQNGAWNMAVDEAFLTDAAENSIATLRFYEWSEPTLSLGYFQRYADRAQHARSYDCAVVRRQTGGGAILHDRELTYSLALPASHPLTRQPRNLYDAVHSAFIAALSSSQPAQSRPWTLRIRGEAPWSPSPNEPFLCFQRQSPGDVVFIPAEQKGAAAGPLSGNLPAPGWKLLGSAQRRHRGAILQHGSLLLEKSPCAAELPGLRDLNALAIGLEQLTAAVCTELTRTLTAQYIPSQLRPDLQSKAAELANNKYSTLAWIKRR